MYNPSYLIKSRHDIYYFRYPLPVTQRVRARRGRELVELSLSILMILKV